MANVFSPERQEQVAKSVENITSIFKDRFDQKQFDDFKQNEYAEYLATQQETLELLHTVDDDPEQDNLTQVFSKYKENQRRLFDWASRYKDNPYISNLASLHFQHDSTMLDDWTTLEEKTHAMSRRGLIEGKEERLMEAKIGAEEARGKKLGVEAASAETLTPLKSESERALAEQRRAAAEASRASAAKAAATTDQYTGYVSDVVDPEVLQSWAGTPEGLIGLRQVLEANISRRQGPAGVALNQEFSDITRSMAKKFIDREIARSKAGDKSAQREPGVDWDYSEDSIRAASALINRDEAKDEHVRRRLVLEAQRLGFNPQEVAEQFPDLYTTVLSRPGTSPLTGAVDYRMVTARLFGKTTVELANALGIEETDVIKPEKLAAKIRSSKQLENLNSIALANTPVGSGFAMVEASGGYDPRDPNKKFQNYQELVNFLKSHGDQHVMVNIGGAELDDKDLPKATREARDNTRKIYDALIEKFAPVLARELNLKGAPPAKKSDWSLLRQTGAGKALGRAKGAVGSLFSGE